MKKNKFVVLFISLILGFLVIISIKSKRENVDIKNVKNFSELSKEVENLEKRNKELKYDIEKKEKVLAESRKKMDEKSIMSKIEKEIDFLEVINGNKTLKGEGIVLTIDDNKIEDTKGRNINEDLIHDEDIQIIINDLKRAGAEAISLNDQRITSASEIKCGGPVIRVNQKTYTNPFVIKAIGNKDKLEETMTKKDTYGYILKNVFKIEMKVEKKEEIVVEKYF